MASPELHDREPSAAHRDNGQAQPPTARRMRREKWEARRGRASFTISLGAAIGLCLCIVLYYAPGESRGILMLMPVCGVAAFFGLCRAIVALSRPKLPGKQRVLARWGLGLSAGTLIFLAISFGRPSWFATIARWVMEPEDHSRGATRMQEALPALADYMIWFEFTSAVDPANPFHPVEGNIGDLEARITEEKGRDEDTFAMCRPYFSLLLREGDNGDIRLVDIWGNPLIYGCPPEDPKLMFRLYSMGENGVDENGAGDDIDVSVSYEEFSDKFEDPGFDGNTYKKYRGQFTRIKKGYLTLIRHPGWPPRRTATSKATTKPKR